MSAQLIARPVRNQSIFVIFKIEGGCACCTPRPRETVLPADWNERSRMSLRELLAFPHGVHSGDVKILALALADGLTRERVAELRAAVANLV